MKEGYLVETYGLLTPITVWVFNWQRSNLVSNVTWNDTDHVEKDHPDLVAIFKIKWK